MEPVETDTFINPKEIPVSMLSPMDRGFGDDVFRKMERKKMAKKIGMPLLHDNTREIEEPYLQ